MAISYLPLLKAKPAEFKALSNMSSAERSQLLPLFEVGRIGKAIAEARRFQNSNALTCDYLIEVSDRIAEVWRGMLGMVDAFQWLPDSITESGEHILPYIYSRLAERGVGVVPVIGYDRWESATYRLAMRNIQLQEGAFYCLRLDSLAVEDSEEPEFFQEKVHDILRDLAVSANECGVIVDFGDITALSLEDLIDQASRVLNCIQMFGFKFYAFAGCSLPPTIDGAVKTHDSTGVLMRKEMILWQTLRELFPSIALMFSDYGVRGPTTAEDVISPHTNGKIRYTADKSFFIARGHSQQYGNKGAQMYTLAHTIVHSPYYMGASFSWGDSRILACSNAEFKGGPADWIAIDTNHHLTWVLAEILEFNQKVRITSGQDVRLT